MHHSPLMAQAATLRPSRARLQGTRGRTSSRLALGAWLLLSACGGAQKPSGEAPPAAETPTTSPASETRPELVPVDAPAGTFLWARLKNPAVLTDSLLAATGLPLDWRGLLESRVPELVAVSDLNAPVELAIVVNPNPRRQPLGVLSWGVGSEAAVLQQLDQMNVQAEEGPGGVHSFAIAEATCVVGPSLGSTPSRVVCGKEAQAVDVLGAYALRGLPRQELSGAELHVEVAAAPLQQAYGQQVGSLKLLSSVLVRQVQIDNPRFDRAAADAVYGIVDELIALTQDVESARLQLWNKGGDYEVALSGRFPGSASWSVETFRGLGSKQALPPDSFWELPANASAAYFAQAPDAARTETFWTVAKDLLAGYLESNPEVTKATRERIERWFTDVSQYGSAAVAATGPMIASKSGERAALVPAWQLAAVEQDSARHRKLLDELVAILAAPDLRKAAAHEGKSWLPELKRSGTLAGQPGSTVYEWKLSGAWREALELGKEVVSTDASQRAELETALQQFEHGFLTLIPDQSRTWFAWSQAREELVKPFEAMKRQDAARLRGLAALQPLRERPAIVSGFVKLESLLAQVASGGRSGKALRSWDRVSQALPYKGQAPLTFTLRVEPGVDQEKPTEVELLYRVPSQFIADLTAAATQGLVD